MSDMAEKKQKDRWRCCITGCNPKLFGYDAALKHKKATGHRIARWPVRSAAGAAMARERTRNGYYDKYNVGAKARSIRPGFLSSASSSSTRSTGCEDPSAFSVGGEFEGYENCGACDWCVKHDYDGHEWGEDDF